MSRNKILSRTDMYEITDTGIMHGICTDSRQKKKSGIGKEV